MKVLASDYDGTLLFNEKFKEGDLKKIKEFQKAGNLFGLCLSLIHIYPYFNHNVSKMIIKPL